MSPVGPYEVNAQGFITSPGKFEGEPEYVWAFWEKALNGEADQTYVHGFLFNLTDDDRADFPALSNHKKIYLWESNEGFVYHTLDDEPGMGWC